MRYASRHPFESAGWITDALTVECKAFWAVLVDEQTIGVKTGPCFRDPETVIAVLNSSTPSVLSEAIVRVDVRNDTLSYAPVELEIGSAYRFSQLGERLFRLSYRRCAPAENNPCPPTSRSTCWRQRATGEPLCRCVSGMRFNRFGD